MIFLTVGTQAPFDRLVCAVDEWAGQNPSSRILAQIGQTDYRPRHLEWHGTLDPGEFAKHFEAADQLVSHAGMGTIIDAMRLGKPLLVLPRLAEYQEHRNNHQVGTARRFLELGRIHAVFDTGALSAALDRLLLAKPSPERIHAYASGRLVDTIRRFIDGEKTGGSVSERQST